MCCVREIRDMEGREAGEGNHAGEAVALPYRKGFINKMILEAEYWRK